MEYLDFSSVITIIRKYINDERTVVDRNLNEEVKIDQMHLLDQIFASFCDDADSLDFAFDNGQVCRWFNGQARISPRIISFYLDEENRDLLSADIEYNVLPLMYDSAMAVGDAHTLLIQDTTISPEVPVAVGESHAVGVEIARSTTKLPAHRHLLQQLYLLLQAVGKHTDFLAQACRRRRLSMGFGKHWNVFLTYL